MTRRRAPVPSVRTLAAVFGDNAPAARDIMRGPDHNEDSAWDRLNGLARTYGVECVRDRFGQVAAYYLNAGGTYRPTLIWRYLSSGPPYRSARALFRVQSVGDFIETMERRGLRAV